VAAASVRLDSPVLVHGQRAPEDDPGTSLAQLHTPAGLTGEYVSAMMTNLVLLVVLQRHYRSLSHNNPAGFVRNGGIRFSRETNLFTVAER
jgi:hypothetical protein